MTISPALAAYRGLTGLLEGVAPLFLRRRVKAGKEDPRRLPERLGHASLPRPAGPLIWMHGASVGESLSLLALIDRLRAERPASPILVTSGTVTSAELLAKRLPEGVIHQFAPIDAPAACRRFLAHWRPDMVVFAESEFWPNLILGAKASGAKIVLVSGKMSEASARGWTRWPAAARRLLGAYDLILAQDERSAERLRRLGGTVLGLADLKFGAAPLPCDRAALETARQALGARPVILAASTHPGEDEVVLSAFTARRGEARLVIAPRHPDRGPAIADLARSRGFSVARRAAGEAPGGAEVYVADTLGELGLWFRLARFAIVCGSFKPDIGGHNPLEPARLGCAAISGPHVTNWQGVFDDLAEAGGVTMVQDGAALAGTLAMPEEAREALAANALAFAQRRDAEALAGLSRIVEMAP